MTTPLLTEAPSLSAVAEWLAARQPHFRQWAPGRLIEWLDWWARCGALGVVRDGAVILAVGIAYPCTKDQIGRPWNTPTHAGRYLYCEAVVVTRRRAALGLLTLLQQVVPDWRQRILVGRRRSKVRTFGLAFLRRWARRLAAPKTHARSFGEHSPILTYAS